MNPQSCLPKIQKRLMSFVSVKRRASIAFFCGGSTCSPALETAGQLQIIFISTWSRPYCKR